MSTLITVFLRGGADGLALVPPVGDPDYRRLRPRLAQAPGSGLRLDDRFELSPDLVALAGLWRAGQLTVIPAVGSEDDSRSHFVAQPLIEQGGRDAIGGWLGRLLLARGAPGPLGAVAFADALPASLRGAAGATALRDLAGLDPGPEVAALTPALAALYAEDARLGGPARDALAALDRLRGLRAGPPPAGLGYRADDDFHQRLADAARLVRADLGIGAICLDLDGWDSHIAQDQWLPALIRRLGDGLAALAADLGDRLATTSIVVLSEFGRRVGENSALGTDHGHGQTMLVLGGGTPGGVVGDWPGLRDADLLGPGDVVGTSDWRAVLAAVGRRHGADPGRVFPGVALAHIAA